MKKINIIYPPLVEDAYDYFHEEDASVTKGQVFRKLIEDNIIQLNGYPTKDAIEAGIVRDFSEDANLTFEEFLEIYPVFKRYDANYFWLEDEFWVMDEALLAFIEVDLEKDAFSDYELTELEAFFEDSIEESIS
ncbi:hypothetical protein [Fundicoccus culcitae]|uniref:Uncharacterized protein n=1 Tax=Fundicoccus culcitae TaxID=2969821 RepID=A0ABY5P8Y0_9LACT|nr:hypothetical protein [Fundicoccus culcitae]UUX34925.1 hypothetical protein NRE15_04575 [Fundicoccus culcitae]